MAVAFVHVLTIKWMSAMMSTRPLLLFELFIAARHEKIMCEHARSLAQVGILQPVDGRLIMGHVEPVNHLNSLNNPVYDS